MPRASRWSELRAAAADPRLRAVALGAFFGGALFGAAFLPRFSILEIAASRYSEFQQRRREKTFLHPHVDLAKIQPLTYEEVLADPPGSVGKSVIWCVDHPAKGVSYLSGKPSQPLLWTNEAAVPINGPTSGGRCTKVAATVDGVRPNGVVLSYVGVP